MGLTPVHEVFCWLSLVVPCSLFVRFLTVNLHCLELYLWEVCGGERVWDNHVTVYDYISYWDTPSFVA